MRSPMLLPEKIRIVEVGPRDSLQNEKQVIETATKLELIERLVPHVIESDVVF